MKIIERIKSMSKIGLTAKEEEKLLTFIEAFEKQCYKLLPEADGYIINKLDNLSVHYDNIEEENKEDYRHTSSPFSVRYKIKDHFNKK